MRRYLLLTATALFIGGPVCAQFDPACPLRPATLKAMRDCYRPVLVFAPDPQSPPFLEQQKLLDRYADDMMDRNLLYVPVLARSTHFEAPLDAPYVELRQSEMHAVRARFQVAPSEFTVVLVGKDGGEKFRSTRPLSVLRLDALVDAMPMGREEKKARSAQSQ